MHKLPHEILEAWTEDPARYGWDTALLSLYPPPQAAPQHRPGEKGYLANAASRAIASREGLANPQEMRAAWDKYRKEKKHEQHAG